jgi:hypothetical protein
MELALVNLNVPCRDLIKMPHSAAVIRQIKRNFVVKSIFSMMESEFCLKI